MPYRECGCTFLERYYPVIQFVECALCVFWCVWTFIGSEDIVASKGLRYGFKI